MNTVKGQLSIFDIVIEHPTKDMVITPPKITETIKVETKLSDDKNLCPYKIPTVDEIIKLIGRSAYSVNTSKLISDVFECGALAISNLVDFTKYGELDEL